LPYATRNKLEEFTVETTGMYGSIEKLQRNSTNSKLICRRVGAYLLLILTHSKNKLTLNKFTQNKQYVNELIATRLP